VYSTAGITAVGWAIGETFNDLSFAKEYEANLIPFPSCQIRPSWTKTPVRSLIHETLCIMIADSPMPPTPCQSDDMGN